MPIDSIAPITAPLIHTTSTQAAPQTRAQPAAVVQQTSSGYEAYVPGTPPGPKTNGPSVELAESYLNSTVQFQA
jgi:hypothetical protein